MWYKRDYRRHLIDMHITDWNEKFLSEFDVQTYFDNLKRAKINNAMIYLQSHIGLCNYPTKSGDIHAAFKDKPDEVRKLVNLCRSNGISVTGYYSVVFNTVEHDKNPFWRMLGTDGHSTREGGEEKGANLEFSHRGERAGLCCPNNPDYREFLKKQISEMLEYFELDGMFFDMLYWQHYCYCDHCKARYLKEVGIELPVRSNINDPIHQDVSAPELLRHRRARREWIGEFAQFLTDYTKQIKPDITVEHNAAALMNGNGFMCCDVSVGNASDYVGGDLYGDMYSQSFACKFYKNLSKNEPFEYMTSRCQPSLTTHTMTKPYNVMVSSAMMTAAHHGAVLIIDAIDPVGTMDTRVYDRIGEVFDIYKKYEPYFKGKMIEDVGVYYSLDSMYSPHVDSNTSWMGAVNSVKALVKNHVPVGVTGKFENFDKYKVVVAPCFTQEDSKDNDRLLEYVKNGGNLYISTAWNKELVEKLLDAKVFSDTEENVVYFAPTDNDTDGILGDYTKKYPMSVNGKASVIKLNGNDSKVLATLTLPYTLPDERKYASIHSNPPGKETEIPALVYKKYGKGSVIWSAVGFECSADELPADVFVKVINCLIGKDSQSFVSDAPITAEITLFENGNIKYVNAVNLNSGMRNIPIESFEVKVKTEVAPAAVKLLPGGEEVAYTYENGYVSFKTRRLEVFDMYEIVM